MKTKLVLNSLSDFLPVSHTLILWIFTISIYFFNVIPIKELYLSDSYFPYLLLMGGLIFLSGHFLRRKIQKHLTKDRRAIKNNRQTSIILPWILSSALVLLVTYLELIGFMIFTFFFSATPFFVATGLFYWKYENLVSNFESYLVEKGITTGKANIS